MNPLLGFIYEPKQVLLVQLARSIQLDRGRKGMKSFFTSFATTLCITAIAAAQSFTPNDPFFTPGSGAGASENYFGQWYLRNQMPINAGNTGVDVNVIGAWQRGLTGAGVTIGIVDSGFEGDHPDVVQNFRNEFSWSFELSVAQNQAMLLRGAPVTTLAADSHGMSVAGIAGARGGNGIGITGAAPMAGLASLNFVGQSGIARHMAAILFQGQTNSAGEIDPYASVNWGSFANGAPVRVKNHSYSNRASFAATNASLNAALAESAANGVIHLFSTGNQRGALGVQDANRNSYGFTPNFIRVAALGSDGRVAAYSSFGANTFVTAPSGAQRSGALFGMATTDRQTYARGYNGTPTAAELLQGENGDYTTQFTGTSASTPVVAGIMALGVQANSNLDVRMAKHILARTSRQVDANDGSWVTNAAGLNFSNNHGFGLIDADAFTLMAANRSTSMSQQRTLTSGSLLVNQAFTDLTRSFTTTYTAGFDNPMPLEEVAVSFSFAGFQADRNAYTNGIGAAFGDLACWMISPSGTRNQLFYDDRNLIGTGGENDRTTNRSNLDWTYITNAHWGETVNGLWTIELVNGSLGNLATLGGSLSSFSMDFYTGTFAAAPAPGAAALLGCAIFGLRRRRN